MSVEIKQKKKTIPKVVRDLAWNKWIGEDVAKHKCMCCEVNEIRMNSFHCGHVVFPDLHYHSSVQIWAIFGV